MSPLVILGAGSTLRGDDGWAFYFLDKLKPLIPENVHLLWGETTPENTLKNIERIKPRQVLVLDSGDFSGNPGEFRLFGAQEIPLEPLFSHRFPFKFLASEIEMRTGAEVHFLLMKPRNLEFGESISYQVEGTIEDLLRTFRSIWGK